MNVLVPPRNFQAEAYENWLPKIRKESIFLAGPTPRSDSVLSWRPSALEILGELSFEGDVCVPEPFTGDFETQVAWEHYCLQSVGLICVWVPRDLKTMPAFTTNVEFGMYLGDPRMFYGRPVGSPHTSYLDWHYGRNYRREVASELEELIYLALTTDIDNR